MTLEEFSARIESTDRLIWDIGWLSPRHKQIRLWDWPNVVYRLNYMDLGDEAAMQKAIDWLDGAEIRDNMPETLVNED